MRIRRLAAALSLVSVSATVLVACGDDEPDIAPGDVVGAVRAGVVDEGPRSRVLVPTGEIRLRVGEPTRKLADDETRDLTAYQAPTGMTFVPINWEFAAERFAEIDHVLATSETPVVDLVSGDREYRLPPPESGGEDESFFVLVEGEAEDLELRVGFDGVTQTVDLASGERRPGAAKPLYRLPKKLRLRPSRCGDPKWFKMRNAEPHYNCDIGGPLLLPYAAGEWADDGHEWLAVDLATVFMRVAEHGRPGEGGAWWGATGVRTLLRAGGSDPEVVMRGNTTDNVCPDRHSGECRWSAVAVFDVAQRPPKRLEVEQIYELGLGPSWGTFDPPQTKKLTVKGAIPLKLR